MVVDFQIANIPPANMDIIDPAELGVLRLVSTKHQIFLGSMLIYWRRVSLQKDELWRSSWDLTGKSWNVIKTLLFLIGRRNPWEVLDNLRSSTEHVAFQVKSKHGRKRTKIYTLA